MNNRLQTRPCRLAVPRPCGARGFTLIELMVTVAIVAILATVATASYRSIVAKTRRGNAKACLSETAQAFERRYSLKMAYNDPNSMPTLACQTDNQAHYTISLVANSLTATGYTLQAVPSTRQNAADSQCRTLTLNNTGVKTESGTGTVADCW